MSSIEDTLIAHIRSIASEGGDITPDTALLELGLLDSINLVGLIQFVEDSFAIKIPDRDIGADLFATPRTLATYVKARLSAEGRVAATA
jgi:acyl carrier protein